MQAILAGLFSLKLLFVFGVPLPYGMAAYEEAVKVGVDPDWMAAMLVTEHRGEYDAQAVSKRGARGLYQLSPMWANNEEIGTSFTRRQLLDWRINTEVAALVIDYLMWFHTRSCSKKRKHTWVAHYKCTHKAVDHCRPEKRAIKVYERLTRLGVLERSAVFIFSLLIPLRDDLFGS